MCHYQQCNFIASLKNLYSEYFFNKNVLEFGSHNINGTIRNYFTDCVYIGVDVGPGRDVDVVSLAHEYNLPDDTFDVVASCEMFEHDQYWAKSFKNMIRLCRKQGLIFFTCATTGRKVHGTLYNNPHDSPNTVDLGWDYYKNLTEEDFRKEFDFDNLFEKFEFTIDNSNYDLYFYAIKR